MLTPIGTLTGFVAIEKPSDKFGPATYSCKLALTGESAKEMKETIDQYMKTSAIEHETNGKNTKPPYEIKDQRLIVRFKQKAEIRSRASGKTYEFTIKLFDANSVPIETLLNIGEGTECRISYKPYMWSVPSLGGAGVTLQLEMVQIIKLVKYEGSNSDENPFDKVESPHSNPFEEDSTVVNDDTIENNTNGDF